MLSDPTILKVAEIGKGARGWGESAAETSLTRTRPFAKKTRICAVEGMVLTIGGHFVNIQVAVP